MKFPGRRREREREIDGNAAETKDSAGARRTPEERDAARARV